VGECGLYMGGRFEWLVRGAGFVKEGLIGGRRVSSKTVHHCLKEKFEGI
jgi:hypothetical protein